MGGRRSAVDARGTSAPDRRARRRQVAHPRGGLLEARRGGRARNAGRLTRRAPGIRAPGIRAPGVRAPGIRAPGHGHPADRLPGRRTGDATVAPAHQRAWHRHRGWYICTSASPLSRDSRRSPSRSARS
ncbi:LigA [Burkholderia sp. IT-111MI5]